MYYAQNNYPNVKLGTSTDSIKQDGCALVAFSNIVGIDPVTLNQKFIDAGDYANGELIEWANCAKTLGLEWNGISGSALAYPCIAETDHFANLGFPSHFFEVLDANNIVDSLDGQVKPISTYHIVNYYNATPTPQVTTPIMSENDTVVSMLPGLHVGQFRIDGATTVYSVIQVPDPHWETDILKQDWNKIVVLPSDFSADPSTYVAYSQAKLDSANNQIAGLNNQVSTLTTQVNDLNGQVADLQSQLAAAQEAA